MNIITTKGLLLGAALLGALTVATSVSPASARPRYDRRPTGRALVRTQNYVGRVTNVRSATSFDARIGDKIFNVYTRTSLPRRLNSGDVVRINGVAKYNNDIRNADVTVIRNR